MPLESEGNQGHVVRALRRGAVLLALSVLGLSVAAPAPAAGAPALTPALRAAARAHPARSFDVIVEARGGGPAAALVTHVAAHAVVRRFRVINAVEARVTGHQLVTLAGRSSVRAITADTPVAPSSNGLTNSQIWPAVTQASSYWNSNLAGPTIAVVDTGVDGTRSDFGGRVVKQVNLYSGTGTNSSGDGYGHGTLVAGLAGGRAGGYTGAVPNSRIVSLDVFDDAGNGTIGDVVAAADWIYANAATYKIRLANFSLTSSLPSTFTNDPVDRAVERLWTSGIVVVAAAGNDSVDGAANGVQYAPANDPFVITVGATDTANTPTPADDFAAPWSSWGSTPDGFAKPELGAPGRRLNGAVPVTSTMYAGHPDQVVDTGYMWMSGTSFAAPLVTGAAADVVAAHPAWTPDQVKGALMLAAAPGASATLAYGVGEVRGADAAAVTNPPNPNRALDGFLVSDGSGDLVFDAARWEDVAASNPSWDAASWESASWESAAWTSASWTSASWTSASWTSASWTSSALLSGTSSSLDNIWVP
jgi:serine protease AprX